MEPGLGLLCAGGMWAMMLQGEEGEAVGREKGRKSAELRNLQGISLVFIYLEYSRNTKF